MFDDYPYARISDDEKDGAGVALQLSECREASARRAGRIMGEWSDNDISATKAPPRPHYEQMIAAVLAPNPLGVRRRIVVRHTDRLWRNRIERAIDIDRLGKAGIIIMTVGGQEFDLGTAAGRQLAGLIGEFDTGASEVNTERLLAEVRDRAEQGRAHGAAPYGWKRVYTYGENGLPASYRDVEDPEQAGIVREIVWRLLAGETIYAVQQELNRRGVPAPGAGWRKEFGVAGISHDGTRWGHSSVRKIALRPANVGLRVFHQGRPDEFTVPAVWPAIVDRDQHDRVVQLLNNPGRGRAPGPRKHLLTGGIGVCGVCGAHLRTGMRGSRKYPESLTLGYLCSVRACVSRRLTTVDRFVTEHMVALLRRPDVTRLLHGDNARVGEALARVESVRARLDQAAGAFAAGTIDAGQLQVVTARLRPELEEAEAEVRAARPNPHLGLVMETVGDRAREVWQSRTVIQQRAIMEAFGVRVVILKTRRGPGFDPGSVLFEHRSAGGP